ncbi:MASE1 domain-containing protein [Thalassospira lucentensis]|uniref:MASE1 domain-containing protein n=1 Tax=Thalassospira lucentensis TaxID=168935 RepID=UPI003D2ED004
MHLQRHHILRFLVIFGAYFITGFAGLQLQYHGTSQSMVWLPPGIALGTMILWGWRYFPAVFLGSILTTIFSGIPVLPALLIGITSTISVTISAAIIGRFFKDNLLSSLRGLTAFFLIGVFATPVTAAFLGSGLVFLNGMPEAANFNELWLSWTLSSMVGVLIAAPLILRVVNYPWQSRSTANYLELIFIAIAAVIVSSTVHTTPVTSRPEYLFIFVSLPFVIWSAIRFGMMGTTLVNGLIAITIVGFTAAGLGGFVNVNAKDGIREIHSYILIVSFISILMAAGFEKIGNITTRARDGKISRDIHRLRRALAGFIAVFGFGISAVAAWYTYNQLSEASRAQNEQYRRAFEASLREELGRATDSLVAVRTLFDVHGNVSFSTFDAMIAPWVSRRPGVAALEWAPFVPKRARRLIEENAHLSGVENFAIRDFRNGKAVPAPERDGYFPIFYVFPRSGNEKIIGFDLYGDPIRKQAVENALRTGNITLTEPLNLMQANSAVITSLALLSINNRRDPSGPPLGIAIGVLRLTNMITRAARVARLPTNYEIHIADLDARSNQKMIYSNRPQGYALDHIIKEKEIRYNPKVSNFTFGYRDWTIVLHEEERLYSGLTYWQPWAIFIFGATISILLMVYLRSLTRTERQIVDLIAIRTRELENAREAAESAMNQAQQADKAKSEFIAHMSHEFRSPMTSILGYTQLAEDSLQAEFSVETLKNYLSTIRGAGRHVLSLIGDILDISKIEAGKLILEEVPFDLRRVCEEVTSMMMVPARNQENTLHLEIDPDMPGWVIGDPVRLKQVVTNLVSNAVKFTKFGNINVQTSAVKITDTELSFRITVKDEGIGIPHNKLKSIFEAFAQVDTSTARRYGGTGLGLAICQSMVQAMGGTIEVESTEGKGSTFWFDLTLPRSSEQAARELEGQDNTDIDPQEKPKIVGRNLLLVEDIAINRILAQKLLEQEGHTITPAGDGQAALDILAKQDFDAVLMDIHMPVLDGLEATRQIRTSEDPVKATIPVLALTADISNENLTVFRAAGFDAYCTKPLDIKAINSELARLADRMPDQRRQIAKKVDD